jgi:hypothetical protein
VKLLITPYLGGLAGELNALTAIFVRAAADTAHARDSGGRPDPLAGIAARFPAHLDDPGAVAEWPRQREDLPGRLAAVVFGDKRPSGQSRGVALPRPRWRE